MLISFNDTIEKIETTNRAGKMSTHITCKGPIWLINWKSEWGEPQLGQKISIALEVPDGDKYVE